MWSSKPLLRLAFALLAMGGAAALAGCSFSPVYSGRLAEQPSLNLAYAKPRSRLEQLVYQELALQLGSSDLPTAPLVTVVVLPQILVLGLSDSASPFEQRQVGVTATLTIARRDGIDEIDEKPLTITRAASANYLRSGQVLADQEAEIDASERATVAAAESLRLAVLAALSR